MEKLEKGMKPRFIEDLGMRYPTEKSSKKYRYGLYECQYCNKEFETISKSIKSGGIKSCGCQRGRNKTQGLKSNKFYNTWNNMLQRCTNSSRKEFKDYGGRGISVCEEWFDIRNFTEWCDLTHPNIEGMTLDRIDNDKGYSPENCRWADKTTQRINQRIRKDNKSGYVGVIWYPLNKNWRASIKFKNEKINLGSHKTKEEAVLARDNYIIENNLPHKLSGLTKNEKDKR